jgi:hypothetical protein
MKRWFVLLIATLCLGVASAGGAQIASGTSTEPSPMRRAACCRARRFQSSRSRLAVRPGHRDGHRGQFRFLNLDTATYTVTGELPGFTKQARDVIVNTGVNVQIPFTLAVGGLAETVVVTGASASR